jgi:putative SOS response-associated peptidase YedK
MCVVRSYVVGDAPNASDPGGPDVWPEWLGEEPADPARLKALLCPYPAEEMTCWPVSTRVGNVKNNDPTLIEPVGLAG